MILRLQRSTVLIKNVRRNNAIDRKWSVQNYMLWLLHKEGGFI